MAETGIHKIHTYTQKSNDYASTERKKATTDKMYASSKIWLRHSDKFRLNWSDEIECVYVNMDVAP